MGYILIRYSSHFSSNHFSWLADGATKREDLDVISFIVFHFLMWNLLFHSKILSCFSLMSFPDDVADIKL